MFLHRYLSGLTGRLSRSAKRTDSSNILTNSSQETHGLNYFAVSKNCQMSLLVTGMIDGIKMFVFINALPSVDVVVLEHTQVTIVALPCI